MAQGKYSLFCFVSKYIHISNSRTKLAVLDFYYIWHLFNFLRFDIKKGSREVTIRGGSEYQEKIGVKREWIHPWRQTKKTSQPAYYDIVVQELGKWIWYFVLKIVLNYCEKFAKHLRSICLNTHRGRYCQNVQILILMTSRWGGPITILHFILNMTLPLCGIVKSQEFF